jgi:hypothetical protein
MPYAKVVGEYSTAIDEMEEDAEEELTQRAVGAYTRLLVGST